MRSEPTDHWDEASDLRAYAKVRRYSDFAEAVGACDEANRPGGARQDVIDGSGTESYAGAWID
ncbi:MAG: hypothetical protein MUC77_20340 [Chromatiaceae bacterium]|jgi:hypothetical protein|nr:hypothetical protein [Chromatiaceae bacterium]